MTGVARGPCAGALGALEDAAGTLCPQGTCTCYLALCQKNMVEVLYRQAECIMLLQGCSLQQYLGMLCSVCHFCNNSSISDIAAVWVRSSPQVVCSTGSRLCAASWLVSCAGTIAAARVLCCWLCRNLRDGCCCKSHGSQCFCRCCCWYPLMCKGGGQEAEGHVLRCWHSRAGMLLSDTDMPALHVLLLEFEASCWCVLLLLLLLCWAISRRPPALAKPRTVLSIIKVPLQVPVEVERSTKPAASACEVSVGDCWSLCWCLTQPSSGAGRREVVVGSMQALCVCHCESVT